MLQERTRDLTRLGAVSDETTTPEHARDENDADAAADAAAEAAAGTTSESKAGDSVESRDYTIPYSEDEGDRQHSGQHGAFLAGASGHGAKCNAPAAGTVRYRIRLPVTSTVIDTPSP